jgi:hypothetical protein
MRYLFLLIASTVAAAPLASNSRATGACVVRRSEPPPLNTYPDVQLSPAESLRSFDTVFLGEVLVPSRPCSIGFCAGVKVLKTLKGRPGAAALIQVASPGESPCAPATFSEKAQRWVVFANHGTTPGGLKYLRAGEDGPSFAASDLPDFQRLEGHYRMMRAELDQALDERLGRVR